MEKHSFGALDLVLFLLSLLISMCIGLWYALRRPKAHANTNEFIMGGRKMPLLPTALSLLSSMVSGVSLLSLPGEAYTTGTAFAWSIVGNILALIFCAVFVIPVIYRVDSISVYQYLEDRFDSKVLRLYGAALFTVGTLFYMAVVLYAPSVALAGVTNVPVWLLIVSVGTVCTIYTSVGGLRAVVWTDTFQTAVMLGGVGLLVALGTADAGGVGNVCAVASKHGRLDGLTDFDLNPFRYMTATIGLVGGFFYWFGAFGTNQMALQRYCSMSSMRRARALVWVTVPLMSVILLTIYYSGLAMFAHYESCDPLKNGDIRTRDQLLIYYMIDIFKRLPGFSGVFLSCLFSGTLSTVSSGINSLSAVSWKEFVSPLVGQRDERRATLATKLIGLLYGAAAMGVAFAAEPLGGILIAVTSGIGASMGPLSGLMMLAVLVPFANAKGGLAGTICGTSLSLWIFIGARTSTLPPPSHLLPTSVSGCPAPFNASTGAFDLPAAMLLADNATSVLPDDQQFFTVYALSFFLYASVGCVVTLSIGITVSLLTGGSDVARSKPDLLYWTLRPPPAAHADAALSQRYSPVRQSL